MGDRCSVTVILAKEDLPAFEDDNEGFGPAEFEPQSLGENYPSNAVEVTWADQHVYDIREHLASEKIPFYGHHGSGETYGAFCFASDGTGKPICYAMADGGGSDDNGSHLPIVRMRWSVKAQDIEGDEDDAKDARMYFAAQEAAEIAMCDRSEPAPKKPKARKRPKRGGR